MTHTATITDPVAGSPGAKYLNAMAVRVLNVLVVVWMFSGGFVLMEPSPYEVMFLLVLPVGLMARIGLHRGTLNLFWLTVMFIPFALIAAFQVQQVSLFDGLTYVGVTIFLLLTAYFIANYIADNPSKHMRIVMYGYTAAALVAALLGTLAYLELIPGGDTFLLYGRAKAMFKDPNVFGPFLMLPAMYALQRLMLGRRWQAVLAGLVFIILFIGVFVSFSRAAWGYILLSSVMVFGLCYLLEANARQKVKMLVLALSGSAILVVAIAGLISIPSVGALFAERASVNQSYDGGETGRFGRQAYAFDLALQHPWGLGPLEFRNLRIIEEPHDTYVNVIHVYGWGGGLAYWVLVGMTLWRGVSALAIKSANRLLLIPLMATFVPLVLESAIIDTDHWRHYFLIVGLIWGVTTGYMRPPDADQPKAILI